MLELAITWFRTLSSACSSLTICFVLATVVVLLLAIGEIILVVAPQGYCFQGLGDIVSKSLLLQRIGEF